MSYGYNYDQPESQSYLNSYLGNQIINSETFQNNTTNNNTSKNCLNNHPLEYRVCAIEMNCNLCKSLIEKFYYGCIPCDYNVCVKCYEKDNTETKVTSKTQKPILKHTETVSPHSFYEHVFNEKIEQKTPNDKVYNKQTTEQYTPYTPYSQNEDSNNLPYSGQYTSYTPNEQVQSTFNQPYSEQYTPYTKNDQNNNSLPYSSKNDDSNNSLLYSTPTVQTSNNISQPYSVNNTIPNKQDTINNNQAYIPNNNLQDSPSSK